MLKPLVPGTKVRCRQNDRIGAVVPDILGTCQPGHVFVELDGASRVSGIMLEELISLEVLCPVAGEKCRVCIFFAQGECLRFHPQRRMENFRNGNGDGDGKRLIPARIYPHCQDEVSASKLPRRYL